MNHETDTPPAGYWRIAPGFYLPVAAKPPLQLRLWNNWVWGWDWVDSLTPRVALAAGDSN